MAKDYTKLKNLAIKLLEKYGVEITFTLPSMKRGNYNTATSTNSGIADIVIRGIGVKLDFTIGEKKNSSILEGDKKIIFASYDGEELKNGMITTIDGIEYIVVDPGPLRPANTTVINFAQVRS